MEQIFEKAQYIITKFKEHDFANSNILELLGIFFYSGGFISQYKKECDWILFYPFIQDAEEYIFANFELVDKNEYMELKHKFMNTQKQPSFNSYLHEMDGYIMNKYRKKIEVLRLKLDLCNNEYIENPSFSIQILIVFLKEQIEKTLDIYLNARFRNILPFVIYKKKGILEKVFDNICLYYSDYIDIQKINQLMIELKDKHEEHCYINRIQNLIIEDIDNKINCLDDNQKKDRLNELKKNINIKEFTKNFVLNTMDTPYSLNQKKTDFFEKIENQANNIMESNEHIFREIGLDKFCLHLEVIEQEIEKEADSRALNGEDLDIIFPQICEKAINKYSLNVSDFARNMFFEYFMSKKSMIKLGVSLYNFNNYLNDNIINQHI